MATNPKRGRKATNKSQEDTMSDTATEAPVEAEAPAEAPATEAPAEVKDETPPEDALYDAIVAFSNDSDVKALQETYRGVHSSARGKAQGIAMKRAMTDGGVDMDVLGAVLDAFNNLPAASKSSRTKPKVDEATLAAIRLSGLMVAFEALRAELGEDAFTTATEWFGAEAPEEYRTQILKVAGNVTKASTKGTRSSSGGRDTLKEKVADLIARGALPAGSVLKGANDVEATVEADGTITTNGESFTNLSAAARVHRVKEDGTKTSTNGWDFWTFDGKSVGELRKS